MKRRIISTLIFSLMAALVLTGCAHKRQLYTDYIPDQKVLEDMILTTEFSEYDGNTEKIKLLVTNNSDVDFYTGEQFLMQKKENGEWRGIGVGGRFFAIGIMLPSKMSNLYYTAVLKDHVLQPLPAGTYRIGLVDDYNEGYPEGLIVYSNEFTIK